MLAVAGLLVGPATPAGAHGPGDHHYESRIVDAPPLPGVTWQVVGGGDQLTVENRSDRELVVLGYRDEPYVRVSAAGVWENHRSPARYLNQDRYAAAAVPAHADAQAEPDWRQVSTGSVHAWHDHRIHWMSPAMPPQVTDPTARTLVQSWEVPFVYDGQTHTLTGELWWMPLPPLWPWLVAGLALLLAAVAALTLLVVRQRVRRSRVAPLSTPEADTGRPDAERHTGPDADGTHATPVTTLHRTPESCVARPPAPKAP